MSTPDQIAILIAFISIGVSTLMFAFGAWSRSSKRY